MRGVFAVWRSRGNLVQNQISSWRLLGVTAAVFLLAATAAQAGGPPGVGDGRLPPPLPQSTGKTFYVSSTGDDSGPGTIQDPWRTIQHAADTLNAGETALVREGIYEVTLRLTRSGTATAPITISSYPSERVVLRPPPGDRETAYPVAVDTASYVRLHGFVIEGATGPSSADVFVEHGSHHIELSGNEIRNSSDQGIHSDYTTHDLQILGNSIHDNGPSPIHQSHGMYLEGVDQLIANNVVYDNVYGYGIQIYPYADRVLIVNNTIVRNGSTLIASGGIILGGTPETTVNNTKIVNNIVAFNASTGIRSYFPYWVLQPVGNEAYSNLGYGNPGGDFSKWEGGGIDYSKDNFTGDPHFVGSLDNNDFHLMEDSPAIDRAVGAYSPATDFDGVARPQGLFPDIGAFEHH